MAKDKLKKSIETILSWADIKIDGPNPWDIKINDPATYKRVLTKRSLGLGEAYMDGMWDCDNLDHFFTKILRSPIEQRFKQNWRLLFGFAWAILTNRQSKSRAFQIGEKHYDVGNNLYKIMLDKRMVYTCGYWKDAENLDQAQENKLDLICRKIGLKSGQKVLDIGGGWGSFAKYAAEKYGAQVVNITVSKEQIALADELCKGLPVENRLQDYRDINEKFDHIVSLGMIEHVGYKNYRDYMRVANRCLKDDGLFLLHTIGGNKSVTSTDPWIEKYIFPNSMLPSIAQIGHAIEKLFIMEDWQNLSTNYDKTLMAWYKNFIAGWDKIKSHYDERFFRMWKYYLLSCAGTFRSRRTQIWQIVLSKKGVMGGYQAIR